MAGKKVSEMTAQERKLFDQEFQYGFAQKPQKEDTTIKPAQLSTPKDLTIGYHSRINLIKDGNFNGYICKQRVYASGDSHCSQEHDVESRANR